jgi:hypothetical protein
MGMAVFRLTKSFADQRTWQSKIGQLIRRNAFYKIKICAAIALGVVVLLLILTLTFVITSAEANRRAVAEPITPAIANPAKPQLLSQTAGVEVGLLAEAEISSDGPTISLPGQEERVANLDASQGIADVTDKVPDAVAYARSPISTSTQINVKREDVTEVLVEKIEAVGQEESKADILEMGTDSQGKRAESIRAAELKNAKDRALELQKRLECSSCTATIPVERLNEWSQLQMPSSDASAWAWVEYYVLRLEYINRNPDLPMKGYLWEECKRLQAAAQRYASDGMSYEQFAKLRMQEEKKEIANLVADELRRRPPVLPSGPSHVREHGAVLR